MKNALLKFAGLFIEKVPIDDPAPAGASASDRSPLTGHFPSPPASDASAGAASAQETRSTPTQSSQPAPSAPSAPQYPPAGPAHPPMLHPQFAPQRQPTQLPPRPDKPLPPPHNAPPGYIAPRSASFIAVGLRALVPQEYASHLAAHGLHVIAAGAELTSAQALTWGAQVLLVAAECLGGDTQLLTNPSLATVFISAHPVTVPDVPGVIHVTEPLRASEVAAATRAALESWTRAHPMS